MVAAATRPLPCKQASGWGDLDKYIRLGWKPGSASETLEFTVTDFAISRIVRRPEISEPMRPDFGKISHSWKSLVHPALHGVWARNEDGSWVEPLTPDAGKEGLPKDAPSNIRGACRTTLRGLSRDWVNPRMYGSDWRSSSIHFCSEDGIPNSPKYWDGSQPTLGCPYVFNYLGVPWRSQEVVSRVAGTFKDTPGGLPGNDDLGATSASYLSRALRFLSLHSRRGRIRHHRPQIRSH